MNPELVPFRDEECPPRVRLEAHSAGEEPELASHVAACAHCAPYVESLRANSDAYVRARPPEMFLQQLARRSRPARLGFRWVALLGAALSAGIVAVVMASDPAVDSRLKGDRFQIFWKRGAAEPVRVRMDQSVKAGDQLRFSFHAPEAGWLAIFELDGTEAVELRGSFEVTPGPAVLPGAFELDAAPGPEWFVSVYSKRPLDLPALSAQLRGQALQPRVTLECGNCKVEAVRVLKEPL